MTEIIRVGVIGAGRMGKIRVDNFSRIPGVEVAALATPYEAETYEWARASGIPKITEDANENSKTTLSGRSHLLTHLDAQRVCHKQQSRANTFSAKAHCQHSS